MELGEKIRQTRLQAGLSQRALAGTEITRNMLSQIEHGTAKPSLHTLEYLAGRLGKPLSYFLEEDGGTSPNQSVMASARRLYDAGQDAQAALALEAYQAPDPVYDREKTLLWTLLQLNLAENALREGRERYALALLNGIRELPAYCGQALQHRRLLLLGQIRGQHVSDILPSLDGELLLRAEEALEGGNPLRAARLLEAAENRDEPKWRLLRGRAHCAQREYQAAILCLRSAEAAFPKESVPLLERCYRELGDYQQAYAYACKQR